MFGIIVQVLFVFGFCFMVFKVLKGLFTPASSMKNVQDQENDVCDESSFDFFSRVSSIDEDKSNIHL